MRSDIPLPENVGTFQVCEGAVEVLAYERELDLAHFRSISGLQRWMHQRVLTALQSRTKRLIGNRHIIVAWHP